MAFFPSPIYFQDLIFVQNKEIHGLSSRSDFQEGLLFEIGMCGFVFKSSLLRQAYLKKKKICGLFSSPSYIQDRNSWFASESG